MKVSRTVWSRGKGGDNFKVLPIAIHCFNGSPYEAINETYPNKFKEWEFKQVPQGFWNNKDDGIKSTKWLIEEKLKLTDEQLKEKLSRKLFVENGLGGMIQYCFNNNVDEAINTTYPNKY